MYKTSTVLELSPTVYDTLSVYTSEYTAIACGASQARPRVRSVCASPHASRLSLARLGAAPRRAAPPRARLRGRRASRGRRMQEQDAMRRRDHSSDRTRRFGSHLAERKTATLPWPPTEQRRERKRFFACFSFFAEKCHYSRREREGESPGGVTRHALACVCNAAPGYKKRALDF